MSWCLFDIATTVVPAKIDGLGSDIEGEAGSRLGHGTTMAAGSLYNNGNGEHSGHLRLYRVVELQTPFVKQRVPRNVRSNRNDVGRRSVVCMW